LTDVEIAVLQVILQASPVDHDVLLGQLGHARFKSNWAPEGSPSFDIEVAEGPRPSRLPDGPLPVSAEIHDSQGEYTGELIVWVTAGFISALEYAWITDSMPLHLPDPASLHISADA
jgi:hypothetical protein